MYFDPLKVFVFQVVKDVDEVEYLAFERYIQQRYVGEWFAPDTLWREGAVRLITTYIHITSVVHSVDHYSFWLMQASCNIPFRVRTTQELFDRTNYTKGKDVFYAACSNMMYSFTWPLPRHASSTHLLIVIDYGFMDGRLRGQQQTLRNSLLEVQMGLVERQMNYCPLSNLYASTCG